jgi:peroxiredoxin
VGINVNDTFEVAKKYVADKGFPFPNGRDADLKIARAFDVDSAPTTFFIAPDGEILGRANGEMNEKELVEALEALLNYKRP